MLSPLQVKSFLGHEDPLVREFVAAYFRTSNDPSLVSAVEVWALIDEHGPDKCLELIQLLGVLQPSEDHADRVTKLIFRPMDPFVRHSCWGAIQNTPASDIERFIERTRGKLSEAENRQLQLKRELSKLSFDETWEKLESLSAAVEVVFDLPDDLKMSSPVVVQALARFPQSAEKALVELTDKRTGARWTELISAEVLGKLRHAPATPTLLDLLSDGKCHYKDEVIEALVGIGSTEVVEGLVRKWEDSDLFFRFAAAVVLRRIKRPECEIACLRYLKENNGHSERSEIAEALVGLCSDQAFNDLLMLTKDGELEEEFEESMLIQTMILGRDIPEAAVWRENLTAADTHQQKVLAKSRGEFRNKGKKTGLLGSSYSKGFVSGGKKKKRGKRGK